MSLCIVSVVSLYICPDCTSFFGEYFFRGLGCVVSKWWVLARFGLALVDMGVLGRLDTNGGPVLNLVVCRVCSALLGVWALVKLLKAMYRF
jgi:hypothetical protein